MALKNEVPKHKPLTVGPPLSGSRLSKLIWLLSASILYIATAKLGMSVLSLQPSNLTLLWLPAGIGLVMCTRAGWYALPFIFFSSFAANISGMLSHPEANGVFHTLISSCADVIGPALATLLMKRRFPKGLASASELFPFYIVICLLPASLGAGIIGVNLAWGAYIEWSGLNRFIAQLTFADSLGILLVFHFYAVWRKTNLTKIEVELESSLLLSALLIITLTSFSGVPGLIYLIPALLVYVAFRKGERTVTLLITTAVILLLALAHLHLGAFALQDKDDGLLALIIFALTIILTPLSVMLHARELRSAVESRNAWIEIANSRHKKALALLEYRIEERTRDLELARQEAEQANNARKMLLAGVSHELRSPLHQMLGYTQLMEQRKAFDPLGIRQILRSGRYLLRLINEMIDYARNDHSEPVVQPAFFSPDELFDNLGDYSRALADKKADIKLRLIRDPACRFQVESDEQRIYQIVTNLLDNAFRYTRQGWVELRMEYNTPQETDQLYLKVQVTDTGCGISAAHLQRVFTPFDRVDQQVTGNNGLGLGLALSQQYAQQLGGTLSVISDEGRGSSFTLELPQLRRVETVTTDTVGKPCFTGTVLVVDDAEANLLVLKHQLSALGLSVVTARSVADALTIWPQQSIDLLVSDQYLGDGTCWDLLPKAHNQQIPVIVVSAAELNYPTDLPETGISAESIDFLAKPIWEHSLLRVLEKHLPKSVVIEIPNQARQELKRLLEQHQLLEIEALAKSWLRQPELAQAGQQLLDCCETMDLQRIRTLFQL